MSIRLSLTKGNTSAYFTIYAILSSAVCLPRKELIAMLSAEDANKIIAFLSAAYFCTDSPEAKAEFNRLANELRKASGQPEE